MAVVVAAAAAAAFAAATAAVFVRVITVVAGLAPVRAHQLW